MPTTTLILAPQQKQQLNVHLVQQMKLLQLNILELDQYVQEAVEANPLLEFTRDSGSDGWQETDGREYSRSHGTRSRDDEPAPDPLANAARQTETLQQVLLEQLGCQKVTKQERQLACYIIGTLDGNGWWREDVSATAKAFGVTEPAVEAALRLVQQLEPAGVGARNLSQCLELQLRPMPRNWCGSLCGKGWNCWGRTRFRPWPGSSIPRNRPSWQPGSSSAAWIPGLGPGMPVKVLWLTSGKTCGWIVRIKGLR